MRNFMLMRYAPNVYSAQVNGMKIAASTSLSRGADRNEGDSMQARKPSRQVERTTQPLAVLIVSREGAIRLTETTDAGDATLGLLLKRQPVLRATLKQSRKSIICATSCQGTFRCSCDQEKRDRVPILGCASVMFRELRNP